MTLPEIPVAGGTAAIEPSLDYIVAKFPRFPFDKFQSVPNVLGTQMKATGEVMGIGTTLEECFLKSVRSLETGVCHFRLAKFDDVPAEELLTYLAEFHDDNIYAIAELLRRGESVERIHAVTAITELFLESLQRITRMEQRLAAAPQDADVLREAKIMGIFPTAASRSCGTSRSWTSTICAKAAASRRFSAWSTRSTPAPTSPIFTLPIPARTSPA